MTTVPMRLTFAGETLRRWFGSLDGSAEQQQFTAEWCAMAIFAELEGTLIGEWRYRIRNQNDRTRMNYQLREETKRLTTLCAEIVRAVNEWQINRTEPRFDWMREGIGAGWFERSFVDNEVGRLICAFAEAFDLSELIEELVNLWKCRDWVAHGRRWQSHTQVPDLNSALATVESFCRRVRLIHL